MSNSNNDEHSWVKKIAGIAHAVKQPHDKVQVSNPTADSKIVGNFTAKIAQEQADKHKQSGRD